MIRGLVIPDLPKHDLLQGRLAKAYCVNFPLKIKLFNQSITKFKILKF